MTSKWEIGEEARELDNKTIIERMKIQKSSLRKILIAIWFYFLIMIIFYFVL